MHLSEETLTRCRDALLAALEGERRLMEQVLEEMETSELEVLYSAILYLHDEVRTRLKQISGHEPI